MAATISEHYGVGNSSVRTAKTFIAGVECEIESIHSAIDIPWEMKEDHSLRNCGREFVSSPLDKQTLLDDFLLLHKNIRHVHPEQAFSERTSIHVHVNCCSLDMQKTRNIVLLYALFEEYFFKMCQPSRRANIHCTPLTETHLPGRYTKPIQNLVEIWSKYTALNILPLTNYGTIEFRHMHGHKDPQLFADWLTLLEKLWTLGQEITISADTLQQKDVLLSWFSTLFGHTQFVETTESSVMHTIQNSLIDLKLAV